MQLGILSSLTLLGVCGLGLVAQTSAPDAQKQSQIPKAVQKGMVEDQEGIVGQWQGTVQTPQPMRVVLKVVKSEGQRRAYLISLDQSPDYIPVTDISASRGEVRFSVAMVQGTYQGTVSADGNEIDGTWTQGKPSKLDLHRAGPEASWLAKSTAQSITVAPGVSLEIIDWGGSGPPLVFLAGLGNTAHIFDHFAPKFVPAYHVYGITRRGFGESSSPTPDATNYRADQLGDDVLKVIDVLGLNKPVLVGHSIAGEELSSIGSRYPKKVGGLIYLDAGWSYALYSPDVGDAQLDAEDVRKQLDAYLAARPPDLGKLRTDLLAELSKLQKDLEADKKLYDLIPIPPEKPGSEPPFATFADAIIRGAEKYTDIQGPILAIFAGPHSLGHMPPLVEGKKAEFVALDQARTEAHAKAFQKLNSAKVIILPNADHYVFLSNEQDVEKAMKDFLTAVHPTVR